ncbi:hypothetical protein POM88_051962 [Heracleum sosnowskyi]|uniref:Uncharacterized protein n=1 Tax=Heracleum sosnowskyi TaxID=360622 RepID=A0AAD8LZ06_9APIA|nr:hypothetical protein POM88_051962 [Heracleum sosnowskyi]
MNTVLSLLAVDYQPQKLSCYLSDDGASPLTYYSLVEASKFDRIWVPFCKKYEISMRAPFRYFTSCSTLSEDDPFEFQQEWKTAKDKYDLLCQKIEDTSQTYGPEVFSNVDKNNHPTVLKVVVDEEEGLPHLVYISREKRPTHPHNFKAGAMNVLVGWKYGSLTENILTGLGIHGKGWRSVNCTPTPPAFLGCAPSCRPSTMIQTKRWATGLLEILFSFKSPIVYTINGNLQFRQCLAYMWILSWGLRSIPELVYALLPAYCIFTCSHFLPKVNEPAFLIPVAIFVTYNLYTIILKLIGLSEIVFEVTQKNQATDDAGDDQKNINSGKFTFINSPIFIPCTTILLVNSTALAVGMVVNTQQKPSVSRIYLLNCYDFLMQNKGMW